MSFAQSSPVRPDGFRDTSCLYAVMPLSSTSPSEAEKHFAQAARTASTHTLRLPSYVVCLSLSSRSKLCSDETGEVTIVFQGELYLDTGEDACAYLLRHYQQQGMECVRSLNGSFQMLIVDSRRDEVYAVIDRLNSHRLYHCRYDGIHWISNSLSLLPVQHYPIDLTGLACYLANGVFHHKRTIYEGVQVLERACIHKLTAAGVEKEQYWRYQFTNDYASRSYQELQNELGERLIEAVRVRTYNTAQMFLSLSSGYDSLGILGILVSHLRLKDIQCITYGYGKVRPPYDAYYASQIAQYYGVPHQSIESYLGNFTRLVDDNAVLAEGHGHFCSELDVWREVAPSLTSDPANSIFVGDECLGWLGDPLHSFQDALYKVSIYPFDSLAWLRPHLPGAEYERMREGWQEEITAITQRYGPIEDYHDLKDYLYMDQRVADVVQPWREFFIRPLANVRSPLLDNRIFDFFVHVPSQWRRDKKLYIDTIAKVLPEFSRFRKGTLGSRPDWPREIHNHRAVGIEQTLQAETRLDAHLPPSLIRWMLEENSKIIRQRHSPWSRFQTFVYRVEGRARRMLGMRPRWRDRKTTTPQIPVPTVLLRILTLRRAMQQIEQRDHSHSPAIQV